MGWRWIALVALSIPGLARAEGRALLVEERGHGWSLGEVDALGARLAEEGYELVRVAPPAPRPRHVDEARFAALSKQGLVALARGQLDAAASLLDDALAFLGEQTPPELETEGLATCLDRARVALEREGEPAATSRVEACRRAFPFGEIDARRAPPELLALVRVVDARRVRLTVLPPGDACRARVEGGAPLSELVALPGVERTILFECGDGTVRAREVRFEEGATVDVTPSLDDRLEPGAHLALRSERPREDARALAARHDATVFLLSRDEGGVTILRVDANGGERVTGDSAGEATAKLFAPQRRPLVTLRRVAAWSLGAASVAAYAAALAPMRRRANAVDVLAATPYHEPAFLALREEFGADRGALRLRAAIGAIGGVAASVLARPLRRPWAFASGGVGVALALAALATFVAAPSCDPGQEAYASCLSRDVRRDRALLLAMAAAPLFSLSARSIFARGRSVAIQAGAGSLVVSFRVSGPPGPRTRDGVWFGRKE